MKNILIETIMTKNPICVGLDDRLHTVKDIFDTHDFRHLLVIEDGELYGILSDRDLFRNISPNVGKTNFTFNDVETLNQPVHRIMTRKPVTLKPDATLKDAVIVFNTRKVSAIPIIDDENKPVGILSWKDVMRNLIIEC